MVYAESIGVKQEEFWTLTPFQFDIKAQADERRYIKNNSILLMIVNTVRSALGGKNKHITFEDILGIEVKHIKQPEEFNSDEEYIEYCKEEGLIDDEC